MLKKVFYFSLTFVVLVNIFVLIFNKSEAQNTYCTPVPSLIWGSSTWPGAGRLVMTSSTQGVLIEYSGAPIVTGSGSINKIAFWTGSNVLSSDANLHWDNINKRLGINTTSPSYELDVNGTIRANQIIGTYTGTINAANVSAGQFGANTGGGNYYFMGNVGIGTTTPAQKLHVVGQSVFGYISGSKTGVYIGNEDPYGRAPFIQGVSSTFGPNNLVINPVGGNVGIGTTAPGAKLDVVGNVRISGDIEISGSNRWIIHSPDDGRTTLYIAPRGMTDWNWGAQTQFANNGNVYFSGNVGIGTTAPNANNPSQPSLDVAGFIRVNSNHTWDPDTYARWFILRKARLTSNPYLEIQLEDGNLYGISIWLSKTESKMNITDLEIDPEKIYELRPVSFNLKSSGIRTFGLLAEETYKIIPELVNLDDKGNPLFVSYELLSVLNTAELKNIRKGLKVDKTGNIGIGISTPSYKLDVNGDIRTTGCLLYNGGTLGTCVSEQQLKNVIGPFQIDNALSKIIQLKPVKYTFKFDPGQQTLIGLLAEETEKIAPELIEIKDGHKQIKYGELQWMQIEAIKELNNKIKEQQKEIDELKTKLNSLMNNLNSD